MKNAAFSLILILAPVIVEAKPLSTNQDRPSKITVLQTLDLSTYNGTIRLQNGCFIRLRQGLNGPATNVDYTLRAGQELSVRWVEASFSFQNGSLAGVSYRLGLDSETQDLPDGETFFNQSIHTIGCTGEKGIDSAQLDEAFTGILSFEWQK